MKVNAYLEITMKIAEPSGCGKGLHRLQSALSGDDYRGAYKRIVGARGGRTGFTRI